MFGFPDPEQNQIGRLFCEGVHRNAEFERAPSPSNELYSIMARGFKFRLKD
jgi:hypothetical protein